MHDILLTWTSSKGLSNLNSFNTHSKTLQYGIFFIEDRFLNQASPNRFCVIHQITLLQMQSIPFLKKYFLWFVFRTALQMLVTLEHNSVQPTMMSNTRDIFMSGSLCITILLHRVPWNVKLWERTWLWSLPQKC